MGRMTPTVVVAVAVAASALVGCGTTTRTVTQRVAQQPVANTSPTATRTTAAPIPARHDYRPNAERAVRSYYRALNDQTFATAWARLSPQLQSSFGGFDAWKAGFKTTAATHVTYVDAVRATATRAVVAVRFTATDVDACATTVRQNFAGSWRLERSSGRWIAVDVTLKKTGGGTPVTRASDCDTGSTDEASDSGDPCDPASSAYDATDPTCDSTDSGNPCDPSSSAYDPSDPSCGDDSTPSDAGIGFCDTHACIPNFDNGTGYPVQCADGMWSDSGGRQGACSGHGGEG